MRSRISEKKNNIKKKIKIRENNKRKRQYSRVSRQEIKETKIKERTNRRVN